MVLEFRPKLAVQPSKIQIPVANILADIENIITTDKIPDKFPKTIEHQLLSPITTTHLQLLATEIFLYKDHTNQWFSNNNPDVIVTHFDKGNVTVLMKRSDYNKLNEECF